MSDLTTYPTTQTPAAGATPDFAGYGSRVWASTLDAIFLFFVTIVAAILLLAVGLSDMANGVGFLVSLLYFTWSHGSERGQTWGQRIAKIRVRRDGTNGRLGYPRAFLRWLTAIGLTLLFLIPNLLDVLWPLWDRKRQALRDKVAGSIVVRA